MLYIGPVEDPALVESGSEVNKLCTQLTRGGGHSVVRAEEWVVFRLLMTQGEGMKYVTVVLI